MHLHWHAKWQKKYEGRRSERVPRISVDQKKKIVRSLADLVSSLRWNPKNTEWGDYYNDTNYSGESMRRKGEIIDEYVESIRPATCWDLGANDGTFTRRVARKGVSCLAADVDPVAVEKNYQQIKQTRERNILPLLLDLTNPSPSLGWSGEERNAFFQRGKPDLAMGLALIHHLAISNNLPFDSIARFFSEACRALILEFVPKSDSKVQDLLATRPDIFPDYTREEFEKTFSRYFDVLQKHSIPGSERFLYLFRNRGN
jgi:hypothetical protein